MLGEDGFTNVGENATLGEFVDVADGALDAPLFVDIGEGGKGDRRGFLVGIFEVENIMGKLEDGGSCEEEDGGERSLRYFWHKKHLVC